MILITEARYNGVYEKGPWAAFAVANAASGWGPLPMVWFQHVKYAR